MNLLTTVTLTLLGCLSISAALAAQDRDTLPNIVILYADDMGYGDLGIQNPESRIPTPHLDRLAGEGLRFTDGHSSSGICTPSRYALLCGRYHWRKFHGIVNSFDASVIDDDRLTLPEMLKARGYRTACIGKWHLGWGWEAIRRSEVKPTRLGRRVAFPPEAFDWTKRIPHGPVAHGFDHYFGDDVPNFPPYTWIEDDRVLVAPTVPYVPDPKPAEGAPEGRPGPMAAGWKQDRVMPRLTAEAVSWIARQKGSERPFFLFFPWTSPHAPIVPAEEFRGSTKAGAYGDFVHQSDWSAGQVLEALEANGLGEDTIVIFTSDNGPEHYAYPRVRRFDHRSMGPLRGLKRDIWEGGHRVPFVIRWPGVIEPGRVSDALVSQIDLMATLAAVVGFHLPATAAEDSHDLLPLIRGGELKKPIRTALVHNTRRDHYALRSGDWVLVGAPSGGITKVPKWFSEAEGYAETPRGEALYDLRRDLAERRNRLAENPEKAAELRVLLERIRARGQVRPGE